MLYFVSLFIRLGLSQLPLYLSVRSQDIDTAETFIRLLRFHQPSAVQCSSKTCCGRVVLCRYTAEIYRDRGIVTSSQTADCAQSHDYLAVHLR